MTAPQPVPNSPQLQLERVPEATKVLQDIRQVIREELQQVIVSCKCCPQGIRTASQDLPASSTTPVRQVMVRKATPETGDLGAASSNDRKSSTSFDRERPLVLPGEVFEAISENSAEGQRSSRPPKSRPTVQPEPKASPKRRLVLVEDPLSDEHGNEEVPAHADAISMPLPKAKPRTPSAAGRSDSLLDRTPNRTLRNPQVAPRVNSNLSAPDVSSSLAQLEGIEDLQQRRRRGLVRAALEQTAQEPPSLVNDPQISASAAALSAPQESLQRGLRCAASMFSRLGDFLVFFVPRVCGAVPWYDFKREHSPSHPGVRASLHLVWRALLVLMCFAAAANSGYRLATAVEMAQAESLAMSAWRAMNTLDPTSLPDLAIAAAAAFSLLLSGVSIGVSEEADEDMDEDGEEQPEYMRSKAASNDFVSVGVGLPSVHARSRYYNRIPRMVSKSIRPSPVSATKALQVRVAGFARGLSLLTQYAPVLGFEASWGRTATLHVLATIAAWFILIALRVGVFGGTSLFGASSAVDNVCFAVVSGVLMALCFSLNMVAVGLASMVDAYCREVAAGSDDVEVVRKWAVLEAVIRSVCETAQVMFLSLTGLSCVAGLCIVVSQPRAGDEVKLMADALLVAAVIGSCLWTAGSVTEKCMQVPSFVTWRIAADPDELHWDWVRVAEHITQSRAGFFLFRMRLDLASAVRLVQLFSIVALSSNVRALGSL